MCFGSSIGDVLNKILNMNNFEQYPAKVSKIIMSVVLCTFIGLKCKCVVL